MFRALRRPPGPSIYEFFAPPLPQVRTRHLSVEETGARSSRRISTEHLYAFWARLECFGNKHAWTRRC